MVQAKKMDASYIKASFIDFLLENDIYDLIVSEVPFLRGNRWADILAIKNNCLIGFEIKSEFDSLSTINNQIDDYLKVFNVVYIVVAEKFLKSKELKVISKCVGIIVCKDGKFKIKRHAITRKQTDKHSLSSMLWRKDLEELYKQKNIEIHKLRDIVCRNYSYKLLLKAVIKALKERYLNAYNLFLRDRENYTTIEDLRTITKINKPIYF